MPLPAGRISGKTLRALAASARGPLRTAIAKVFRQQLGIDALRALPAELRGALPLDPLPLRARNEHPRTTADLPLPQSRSWPRTSQDLRAALQSGRISASELVTQSIAAARQLAEQSGVMAFDEAGALDAAIRSAERIAEGRPLPLDGIPLVVKEELDVSGFPTKLGTGFIADTPATADATAVARLRQAGGIIIGQSPMTQYGLSPLGVNPHRKMPKNPHDTSRVAGGSSTGTAVAVASGVVPAGVGLDGGGSIRIPAAYNGIFGIKPTFGRVPLTGHGLQTGTTLVHAGPLAGCTYDLALLLAAMAGADGRDRFAEAAPPPEDYVRALGRGVRGLRIGVLEPQFEQAAASAAAPARAALDGLVREGAELVRVELPLLLHATAMGFITIGLEAFSGLLDVRRRHFSDLNLEAQLTFRVLGAFDSDDYLDAQRLRSELRDQVAQALRDVDVLALPTTGDVAPKATDAEFSSGFVDADALDAACRFAFLGNLTGLPAISVPVGKGEQSLPVGLQFVGDAWDEATLFQVAAHLERVGLAQVMRPARSVDLLA